ncbi:large ribosomal subunit protein uL24m [Prorops nasuta]|uniref:large ribosomal subunit protein uL24m n=1 Tax=Prorops nasuta TaxID=863751 RepID=UPI0034CFF2EE
MRLTLISLAPKIGKWSKRFANLPDSYIKRASEIVYYRTPKRPGYQRRAHEKKNYYFSIYRPWTQQFFMENVDWKEKVFVEPLENWNFFRGDRVELLAGPDKGKQGIVKMIIEERNWVIVDGLNLKLTSSGKGRNKFYFQVEQPLLVTTEVALIDPSDSKPTEIDWRYLEDGQRVRVSIRTGRPIPIPAENDETIDYKSRQTYKEKEKDTKKALVVKETFQPQLKTFEMDIMDKMGIKEDRIPKKTYWY